MSLFLNVFIFVFITCNNSYGFNFNVLSDNQKAGLEEYKKALGVQDKVDIHGNDNTGIRTYFDLMLKNNPCLITVANSLYQEIRSNDVISGRYKKIDWTGSSVFPINKKVPNPEENNGYFWKTALRHAQGNKNLAMTLIGICGHDDILQSDELICPLDKSNIYYPESLGKNADISDRLKKRIVTVQGEDGNADHIPAKYYHVISAAVTSCLLLQRGVPEAVTKLIAITAVNGYRSGRLCEAILSKNFERIFEDSDRHLLSEALKLGPNSTPWKTALAKVSGLSQKDKTVQKRKLQIALSHFDARVFFRDMQKIKSECDEGLSNTLTSFLKSFKKSKNLCPKDFNSARCQRMLDRIESWEVDRVWTEAQHIIGVDFAIENCPPTIKTGKEIEEAACKSL